MTRGAKPALKSGSDADTLREMILMLVTGLSHARAWNRIFQAAKSIISAWTIP